MLATVWEFLKTSEGASLTTALSTVVLTVTTMVYAWLTAILARENKLLRKAGTEPQVVAYLTPHPRIIGPLQFALANVGQGPAFNVRFRLVSGGHDFEKHRVLFPKLTVPLTVIPQGDRYETFIGMGPEMFAEPRLEPFTIEVSYRDLKKREHVQKYEIDVGQFEGFGRAGNNPQEELARAARDIVGEMQNWRMRPLPVETVTRAELRQEEQEFAEQVRRRREGSHE
ncbi:hypothetical protein [Bradyrhizobium sp. B120]|uniref:hypothetical protein n=1 Tax=Bradyrhizobium sp. B120 TaxID=3410088 RepID=UPI003B984143